jgi:hypothetical protein
VPVINDIWSTALRPRTAPPVYVPVAVPFRWSPAYAGAFRDRQSRFDLRCLRRYGGFSGYLYEAPLVILWADDYYSWGADDVWEL